MKMFIFDVVVISALLGGIFATTHGAMTYLLLTLALICMARWYFLGVEMGETPVYDSKLPDPVLTRLEGGKQ